MYISAAPLAIAIIARVAINGGVLNLVTISPFNILQATATIIATTNASKSEPVDVYADTESTPASAKNRS